MRRAPAPRLAPRALLLAFVFGALLATGLTPIRPAAPVSASTAQTMASDLLAWINSARVKHGLGALRTDSRLASLATQRAGTLASLNLLSHSAPGCLSCQVATRGVSYNFLGEVLASNTYTWGAQSASIVFDSWRKSPPHWDILMAARVDTIGIGLIRSSTGATYASAILIDAPGVVARKVVRAASVSRPPAQVAAAAPLAPSPPAYLPRESGVRLGRIAC